MGMCVAYGCTRRKKKKNESKAEEEKITFHHFPKDEETKLKWVEAIKRENWQPTEHSLICSKHFLESDFDKTSPFRTYLKKEAVPSLFPFSPSDFNPKPKCQKRKMLKKAERSESPESEKRHKTESEIDTDSVEVIIAEPDISLDDDDRVEDVGETPPSSPRGKKAFNTTPRSGESRPCQPSLETSVVPSQTPRDQYSVFGELVGLQIRDLPSFKARMIVRQIISTVLFDAAMGKYDDLTTVPQLEYSQPPGVSTSNSMAEESSNQDPNLPNP